MMEHDKKTRLTDITSNFPYRVALAGGWIDQPFISQHHPAPPGSMVVVSLVPQFRFMDRAGFASSTRRTAEIIWKEGLPEGEPSKVVRDLYAAENERKEEPSGSQDMIGIIYPGINRLDYDFSFEGGHFPAHIESCLDPEISRWLENKLHLVPVSQRPEGYKPLGVKNLDPEWILRLGQSGKDCYSAILQGNEKALGRSLNECMNCWEAILPHTVRHPTIHIDLLQILRYYRDHYLGAMFSGCGGGYLIVVSNNDVPGSFKIKVRLPE